MKKQCNEIEGEIWIIAKKKEVETDRATSGDKRNRKKKRKDENRNENKRTYIKECQLGTEAK